jgi:hypothetical protein
MTRINMILTMVPTAANKTLVLFEEHGGIIADNFKKHAWSLGYVSAIDSQGRTICIAEAHRGDGKRFVVQADELLTAFVELEAATRACGDASQSRNAQHFPIDA